ncbi:MAG: GAF domain-containing protein, partial [Catalinimonas sp.]
PEALLRSLCGGWEAVQGALFEVEGEGEARSLRMTAGYAYFHTEGEWPAFKWGEGLVGQVARERRPLHLDRVPDNYLQVLSGLGQTRPRALALFPVCDGERVLGVVEVALFRALTTAQGAQLPRIGEVLGARLAPHEPVEA